MKRLWNGLWMLIFVSIGLYVVGHVADIPLLMWKYDIYEAGYLVDTKSSVLPFVVGSLVAVVITRK